MAPDDHSGARPAGPVVLRIKLRYDDVEAMVQRFASNVGKSGLFLPTKSIQPIGTEVKFELRLANDVPVLVGMGRVRYAKHPDPANPKAAFGMAIELTRVSREGRSVIIRMIEKRRALGLPDVAIPLPDDAEAARRGEVETQPRAETSAVVRDAMTQLASAPVAEQLIGNEPASGPIGVAKERPSAPLLTSARPGSGPIAVLRDEHSARVPVPALAPEKSRPRRPRVQELIDKASELSAPIIAAMPVVELDMHVDVERVLSRARALAGGELEAELETLREAAAAPIEISVEAASAELARQLGGKPVAKRERSGSARWAPPPAIETRAVTPLVEVPAATPVVESAAATPVVESAAATPVVESAAATPLVESAAATPTVEAPAVEARDRAAEAQPDFAAKTRAETEAAPVATIAAVVEAAVASAPDDAVSTRPATPTNEARYEDAMAAAAPLDDAETPVLAGEDYVEAFVPNPTTITGVEDSLDVATERPKSFGGANEIKTEPTNRALLIDDDADVSSFERALDDEPAELLASGEYQLADDAGGESTHIGTPLGDGRGYAGEYPSSPDQLAAQLDQQLAEAEQELERELAADGMGGDGDGPEEEISELDVLAEADEEDEDLLAAHGESEVSGDAAPVQPIADAAYDDAITPPPVDVPYAYAAPEPVDDFAARLDLGDDDEPPPSEDFDREAAREFDEQVTRSAHGDYVEQLRPAYDERVPRYRRSSSEPSSSYTFAENYPDAGLHLGEEAAAEFDEPHSYAPSTPRHVPAPAPAPGAPPRLAGPDPRLLRYGRATTASTEDLEDALAALDVDFDDLSADQRRSHRPTPSSTGLRPLPGLPIERPPTGQHPIVTKPPTGQHPIVTKPPTGQHAAIAKPITGQHVPIAAPPAVKRATMPPPIPAAARRQPTRQVPVVQTPTKRATTEDDGVLIDFDDDE